MVFDSTILPDLDSNYILSIILNPNIITKLCEDYVANLLEFLTIKLIFRNTKDISNDHSPSLEMSFHITFLYLITNPF